MINFCFGFLQRQNSKKFLSSTGLCGSDKTEDHHRKPKFLKYKYLPILLEVEHKSSSRSEISSFLSFLDFICSGSSSSSSYSVLLSLFWISVTSLFLSSLIYFIISLPALCMLSWDPAWPQELHWDLSSLPSTNLFSSGYLHPVQRMYLTINLSRCLSIIL